MNLEDVLVGKMHKEFVIAFGHFVRRPLVLAKISCILQYFFATYVSMFTCLPVPPSKAGNTAIAS